MNTSFNFSNEVDYSFSLEKNSPAIISIQRKNFKKFHV